MKEIAIQIIAHRREDGSVYMTSPDLRGFHYICPEGKNPEHEVQVVLAEFLPLHLKAKSPATGFSGIAGRIEINYRD